jgi:UDPglucose 6-dehydrogenase
VKISVIGVGHVGLVSAAAFARWGHEVFGMDDDLSKVERLRQGESWFYEPGLDDLLAEVMASGRLRFTSDIQEAVAGQRGGVRLRRDAPLPGGGPNLSFVEAVGRNVVAAATGDLVLVEKSTVPADTGRRLGQVIERERAPGRGAQHLGRVQPGVPP